MNPFPTFSEGVNKSVHMDVGKLKREDRIVYNSRRG